MRVLKCILALPLVVAALAALLVLLAIGYGRHPDALEEID